MLTLPEPIEIDARGPGLEADLGRLPRRPGIYVLELAEREPYLGWTVSLGKRLTRLLGGEGRAAGGGRMREKLLSIRCYPTASRLEKWLLQYALAREAYPRDYRERLKLRSPWFVSLLAGGGFARLHLSSRIAAGALSVGPFRTRDLAEAFEQECGGLFQLRRCTEELAPHAEHPGCIYGEMSLCLRPCQAAVTGDEYASEARRAGEFLKSGGLSQMTPLEAAREQASEEMDFEQAARIHKQIDKLKSIAALRGELAQPVEELHGVAVTRGGGERGVNLWPMVAGLWQEPLRLDFEGQGGGRSMDALLREQMTGAVEAARRDGRRVDDLALLARWYYSSWRDGAWLAFRDPDKLNYRRLVKEISNLLRSGGEPGTGAAS